MRIFSKLTGGIAAVTLIAATAAPGSARGWGWQGGYRHHDHGSDAGAVIGAIAAVGIIAAIASAASSSNNRQTTERRYDAPPPEDYGTYDNGAPRPRDDRYDDGARYDDGSKAPRYDGAVASGEDEAVDACALAARDRASEGRNYAEVRGIDRVTARGNGFDVSGQIEQRSSYRANDGWSRNFRCSFADGRVGSVTVD